MTVLVTGGSGMIGSYVVERLLAAGKRVRVVDRDLRGGGWDRIDLELVAADLCDSSMVRHVFKGVDEVYHIAGIKGSVVVTQAQPASFFVPLLTMNTLVLEEARRVGARVLYTSTVGAHSERSIDFPELAWWEGQTIYPPMDSYPGWAKRMGELQLEAYRQQYKTDNMFCVRLGVVYGPGDNFDINSAMVIPSLLAKVYRQKFRGGVDPIEIWGDGTAVRDFCFADDIAEACIQVMDRGMNTCWSYLNLGGGEGVSIKTLVEVISQVVGGFEFYFNPKRPGGVARRVLNTRAANQILGWKPQTMLRDGIKKTWDWLCANPEAVDKPYSFFTK